MSDVIREAAEDWFRKKDGYVYRELLDEMTEHFRAKLEAAVPAKELGAIYTSSEHAAVRGYNECRAKLGLGGVE